MKAKRLKLRKKILLFYKKYFGFNPPYSVLFDGTFCKAALQTKISIMEQLPKYLDAEVKYFTTNCVLAECEALGTLLYGPLKVLRQYQVHNCRHSSPKPATACLRSVTKKHKKTFIVATQDAEFQEKIRTLSGVPLLFIAYNTMQLDPPTDISKSVARDKLDQKLNPTDYALDKIKTLKRETFGEIEEPKKKKKKMKGPNPLSCKKKKKRTEEEMNEMKKKKKRRKIKKTKMTLDKLVKLETI